MIYLKHLFQELATATLFLYLNFIMKWMGEKAPPTIFNWALTIYA